MIQHNNVIGIKDRLPVVTATTKSDRLIEIGARLAVIEHDRSMIRKGLTAMAQQAERMHARYLKMEDERKGLLDEQTKIQQNESAGN